MTVPDTDSARGGASEPGTAGVVHPQLWTDPPRSLGEMLGAAHAIIDEAIGLHRPVKTFALFSGGNDSLVLLDMARRYWNVDGVVHVNTGTGIPETTEFVRATCARWGMALHELRPPQSYEDVFINDPIIDGLPGPGMHHIAYSRLKDRAIRSFSTAQKGRWRDRIMLLTGIRSDESQKRMGYTESVIDREKCRVWVNPLYSWTNDEMRAYKALYRLPRNPVTDHLHFSGECLCGAYAHPGELAELEFFYPEVAARIRGWEAAAEARGLTYSKWGERRPDAKKKERKARLCEACVGQGELFAEVHSSAEQVTP
jgi:3'-phosphoadenosine 5'-phosphosulfate sulfotransferase (PAPS reductase)/FAD synthetase